MDLEQKVGQLFLLGFQGDRIDHTHPICRDIEKYNLGGVLLFDRLLAKHRNNNNITSASQLCDLTTSLQALSQIPLFICVDQEGGAICRLNEKRGFPETPGAQTLGEKDDTAYTASQSLATANLLAASGINFNFAPVVDVNVNPENPIIGKLGRSFSSAPKKVIQHGKSWINGHRQANVLSCCKHFPGHGSSRHDSHLGFVDITGTWQKSELEPFQQLIEDGFADAIMTGHLFNSDLDTSYPATLSAATINGLLRNELHYDGLVISDDLQMKSITDHFGLEEATILALAAGVDMIIVGNNLDFDKDILPKLVHAVMQAVRHNQLSKERIAEAFDHIQLAKATLFKGNNR